MMQALQTAILVGIISSCFFQTSCESLDLLVAAYPSRLSYFGVKRGGASDSGIKEGEAIDHFEHIVLDEERGGNVSTLSHDFVF